MDINFENSEAEKEVFLELLNKFEKEDVTGRKKANVNKYISVWREHILKGQVKTQDKKKPLVALEQPEYFKMDHILYNGEKISMYFDVKELRYWIQNDRVPSSVVELIRCTDNISFLRTDTKELAPSFDRIPVIAVPMYTMGSEDAKGIDETKENGKKYSTYAVVDGNKRVSAALALQKNININMVTVPFLPVQCFKNTTSWVLYNMIEGLYLMAMGDFKDPSRYLKELEGFLNYNYPVK